MSQDIRNYSKVKINPIYILLKGRTNISKGSDETTLQNEAKAQ